MNPVDSLLAAALQPLISRVRTDITAKKNDLGHQVWTREPLTPERLARHLNGGPARGVCPIKEGESVTLVGLLDLDSHQGETPWPAMVAAARDVMLSIELMGGAPIAFRSSGGRGVHVYCLWAEPQDAYSVREWLRDALTASGYVNGTKGVQAKQIEIFPKQPYVPIGGNGSQAILPLAGKSVPLIFEPLLDDLVCGERADVLALTWPMSDPVPVREAPAHAPRSATAVVGHEVLREVLAAIPNSGHHELQYDDWFKVLAALHHETEGSDDGLALLHEISSRSSVYNPEKTDRDWGYARSDGRERVAGIGTLKSIASRYGWHEPLDPGMFEVIEDDRPPTPAGAFEWGLPAIEPEAPAVAAVDLATGEPVAPLPPPPVTMPPAVRRRGIPEAHYLTTDQANAQRLKDSFGSLVFVAAGKWHVWDGRRWVADESDVYRYACRLSDLIREEAKPYKTRGDDAEARGDTAEAKRQRAIAEALGKWALKSEMKGTIEAAIGLARKMLTIESDALDRDPWALNCQNGTVDLRTGVLRRHNPAEYITRLVPVRYVPDAVCPTWERALDQIAGGRKALVGYLARWFGYCLTGKTTEQCFVVHWGPGGNGKSVVLELMAETMGDYAGTAAPGLLVASKGDRHPTEIAALFGRRMVTAHESGEGVVLREDFVKQATGGDKLTARFMREDFFEFAPTHKIQLLTNHKPQVKGQDLGIWRRVQLVPYTVTFGSVEQFAAGTHQRVRDTELMARLRAELEGVLAWRVRGAVEWAQSGLQAPDVVLSASETYKREQDRIGQFVEECCEVGQEFSEALTDGMGGLYPAFQTWCKDAGIFAMSKQRFVDEVLRVLPVGRVADRKSAVPGGGQRRVKMVHGLRLLPE